MKHWPHPFRIDENSMESSSLGASAAPLPGALQKLFGVERDGVRFHRSRSGDRGGDNSGLICRLWVLAATMSARNWLSQRKPITKAIRPPRLSVTMRRVRDEEKRASMLRLSKRMRKRQRDFLQRALR